MQLLGNLRFVVVLGVSMVAGSQFVFHFMGPDMRLHDEIQQARERRRIADQTPKSE